jgi:uncharacterized protein YjbI with pentapeptide repeats
MESECRKSRRYKVDLRAVIPMLMLLLFAGNDARGAGLDQKFVNDHPDRTWTETVGGIFTSGKSVAVVIGISSYIGEDKGGYPELHTTAMDADKVVRFLRDDAGFDVIYVLTEEKVTKARIEQLMIDEARLAVGPHDRFLFYWSGHGDQLVVGERKLGFLPMANSKRNEFSGMVSMGDIARWDTYISAQQALFLLDSCLSGLAGTEQKGPRGSRLQQLSQSGHHLITAGQAGENVIAGDKWTGSLFTDSFIKGAQGEAYSYDGVITLWSIYDYVLRRVDIEREAVRWDQPLTPKISSLTSGPGAFFFTPPALKNERHAPAASKPDSRSESKGNESEFADIDAPNRASSSERAARSLPLVQQLADNIDFRNAVTNKDAISSLVGIATTQEGRDKDAIVSILKDKLQRRSEVQYDTLGRAVRKALLEAIVKIRHHDIRDDFIDGQLVNADLVAVDLSNVRAAGVSFSAAFLLGTNFQGADLRGADLSSSSLRNVRFDNAQLDSANFGDADWFNAAGLTAAQLTTISPKGLKPCPANTNGKYSKAGFVNYANLHYGVRYENWSDDEQKDAAHYWSQYSRPRGSAIWPRRCASNAPDA